MLVDKLIIFACGFAVGGGVVTVCLLAFVHLVIKAANEDKDLNDYRR